MNEDIIKQLLLADQLRRRTPDKQKVKSMLASAEQNMEVIKQIPCNEQTATVIFRETYESIRQLGDARWWLKGYEPRNHEVSIEIIKELDIKEKTKLQHLTRYKDIRNDANYRGFKVSEAQAKEILTFWDTCGKEILQLLTKATKY